MKRSKISWTDFSGGFLNVVLRGRQPGDCEVSPGCAHCYAGAILRRNTMTPETTKYYPDKLVQLRRWNLDKEMLAVQRGEAQPFRRGRETMPLVFVCDMGDLFAKDVPDNFIIDALVAMREQRFMTFQVLTKRAQRMAEILGNLFREPVPNIWIGVSVEDQQRANERIPWLLKTPAAVRFLSCEPLLEQIDLNEWLWEEIDTGGIDITGKWVEAIAPSRAIDWVIVGAESGAQRRPFDSVWAQSIYEQCRAAGVAFFGKQSSGLHPGEPLLIDGKEIKEFPIGHGSQSDNQA